MAKETFDLNKISRYMIHRPSSEKKGQIYYVPLNSDVAITQHEKELFTDKEWNKYKDKYLSSPTNVRRLWITYKGIALETYGGMIIDGKQTNLVAWKRFNDSDFKGEGHSDFKSLAITYLKQQLNKEQLASKDLISIKGNIVSHTNSIWTFNNIEEIYFDWSCLLSEESIMYLCQYLNRNEKQVIQMLLNLVHSSNSVTFALGPSSKESNVLLQIVFGTPEVPKTFKRLNKISFIASLGNYVNSEVIPNLDKFNSDLSNKLAEAKTYKYKSWIEKCESILKTTYSITWSRDITLNKDTFTLKDQVYMYDRKFLKNKVENFYSLLHEKELEATKSKYEKTDDAKELEAEMEKILKLSEKKETSSFISPIIEIAKYTAFLNAGIETGAKSNNGPWINVINDKSKIDARLLQKFNKYVK